jgi:glycosyltransferase involved in cell wall biosynthesis
MPRAALKPMESRPTISVVVPAYNAAPFLRDAVCSILEQTERDFELILINDGSTDKTHAIAQELARADGRIRYFTQDNRGVVATLNRGLELCRGEFIARMDADDVARTDRFEKQLALLRSDPELVLCGSDALQIGEATGRIRKPGSDRSCRAWQLIGPCFVHPSVMFRRTVVDRGVRYRMACQYAEDYAFWFEVAALGQVRNIKEPLLFYRVHGEQITNTRRVRQTWVHTEIAVGRLAEHGIAINRAQFHDILWPEQSERSRLGLLVSTCSLFLRMALKGQFAPYLMLGTCWNIVRHERRPAPSTH